MWVIFFPYPEDQLNPYVESSCSLQPTLGVLSAASRSKFFSQPKIRTVPCERKRREGHAVLVWVIFFPYPEDQLNPYVESSCSLQPTLGVLSAASRSKFFSQPKIRTVPCERKRREGHAVLVWVIFFPYPEDQLNPYVESSCSLQPTLGVLSAASRSFRPSPLIKRLQSWQATVIDRIIDAAANSPSPRKWSMKPRTRRPKTRHFQYLIGGVVNRVPRVLSYWQSLFCAIRQEDPQKSSSPCADFADRLPLAPNFSR